MVSQLDLLEERVSAAVGLIATLRDKVRELERDLASARRAHQAAGPAGREAASQALADEIARLRAERSLVRERVRGLIREIDRSAK